MLITQKIQITETEAAARTGMSKFWFQRKRWEGGGPEYRKIGNRVFYVVVQLDRYFENRTMSSTSDYTTRKPVEALASKKAKIKGAPTSKSLVTTTS
jgi:hypothetical protein